MKSPLVTSLPIYLYYICDLFSAAEAIISNGILKNISMTVQSSINKKENSPLLVH